MAFEEAKRIVFGDELQTVNTRLAAVELDKWLKPTVGGPGSDANDFKTPGFRGVIYGSTPNLPEPVVTAVEVLPMGTGIIQRGTIWDTTLRVYLRRYAFGGFGPWQLQPTPGQVAELETTVAGLEAALPDNSLVDWRTAYATVGSAPAQVLAVGDSITEGTGTTTLANRWQTILQAYLNRQHGRANGAVFPFIPGRYATTATGQPTSDTGTVQGGYGFGLGWRTVSLRDDTAKLVYNFTGTSAKIMHLKMPTSGVMKITVDSAAPVTVNTNGPTDNAALWGTGPLPAGPHTITIERDPNSAASQYVWVEGVLTFNGDESSGVRVIDAAKHGINAGAQLVTANNGYTATAVQAAGPFALAVIAVGTNDYSAGTTPATYRANIEGLIAALRSVTGGFSGSIVLVNMYRGQGRTDSQWTPYGDQLAAIAAADPKTTYLDLRWDMPDVPTPVTDAVGQGMYADGLHPTDAGHRKIAGILANLLA